MAAADPTACVRASLFNTQLALFLRAVSRNYCPWGRKKVGGGGKKEMKREIANGAKNFYPSSEAFSFNAQKAALCRQIQVFKNSLNIMSHGQKKICLLLGVYLGSFYGQAVKFRQRALSLMISNTKIVTI
jgi:hypothetical protein